MLKQQAAVLLKPCTLGDEFCKPALLHAHWLCSVDHAHMMVQGMCRIERNMTHVRNRPTVVLLPSYLHWQSGRCAECMGHGTTDGNWHF